MQEPPLVCAHTPLGHREAVAYIHAACRHHVCVWCMCSLQSNVKTYSVYPCLGKTAIKTKGTAQAKMDALRAANVRVGLNPTEAGEHMVDIIAELTNG